MTEQKIISRTCQTILLLVCTGLTVNTATAQNIEEILNQKIKQKAVTDYIAGTFKGTRIVTGHSVEIAEKNDLLFIVSHRFGQVNSGLYSFFGLDDATTRISFEYGVINNLS